MVNSNLLTTFAYMRANTINSPILNQIIAIAQATAPNGSQVILFGSRARGNASASSDWDILIVIPQKNLAQHDYDTVSYPLVELGWQLNERINPIIYTQDEWEASSITPFYDNVQRDGIKLI